MRRSRVVRATNRNRRATPPKSRLTSRSHRYRPPGSACLSAPSRRVTQCEPSETGGSSGTDPVQISHTRDAPGAAPRAARPKVSREIAAWCATSYRLGIQGLSLSGRVLCKRFLGQAGQSILRSGELLRPELFISQRIEDERGDRILLTIRQLGDLVVSLFQKLSHALSPTYAVRRAGCHSGRSLGS